MDSAAWRRSTEFGAGRSAGARSQREVAFAAQPGGSGDHALLRTIDGQNWTQSGTVAQHRGDFEFTSAEVGGYVYGDNIFHTVNVGKTWKKAFSC